VGLDGGYLDFDAETLVRECLHFEEGPQVGAKILRK